MQKQCLECEVQAPEGSAHHDSFLSFLGPEGGSHVGNDQRGAGGVGG